MHLMDVSMFWGRCGGVRRVLSTKHERLRDHGWRHTVVAPAAEGPDHLDCGGLPLPFSDGYRLVWRRTPAQRLIEDARPDIVESADPYTLAWAVLAAARSLRIPAVAFCHSDLPALAARLLRGSWAHRVARAYLVRLYEQFDLVLAPSHGLTDKLRSWGVPRVVHQPLGVDCSVFTPAAADPAWRHRLCQQLGLHPSTRLLIYSGRFAPEKNLDVVAAAVARLGPGHALLAVGGGPCPPRGSHVRLLPPEADSARLARLIASCDAYVHAGDQETFGLAVLEAMACGTPVVVSAAGGLGELAAGAGLRVDRLQPESWAEAMRAALVRPTSPLCFLALEKAREHDWNGVMARLSAHYLRLVQPSLPAAAPLRMWHTACSGSP